jgi:RNA polymerase sigma factor (sigma-70 family)
MTDPTHLSRITTEWDLVFQAHNGPPEVISAAQTALMTRYAGAVHRYLLGAVRDPDLASDLDQEFALRFLRGDLHRADPSRGRFRDFVKRAVRNLMIDHYRRKKREASRMVDEMPEPADPDAGLPDFDAEFTPSWRREPMAQAWDALARHQQRTGQPFHTVLRFRVESPDLSSQELAEKVTQALSKEVNAGWVRQNLHRARDQFAGYLVEAVRSSMKSPTWAELQEELGELGLLEYCKPAIERRKPLGPQDLTTDA